ncbi:putative ribosomal protein, partial [Escherichia coli R424]
MGGGTRCVQYTKKKPVLSYELFFKYGGEGGIDSLRSPCGQPAHCVHGLSNWLSPVVDPRSGLLIPPVSCNTRKK